ncbi:hypothetical protein [Streptomyces sp. NPDC004250]|uniref:hypothetical protein n=1 Tax=Streptomyces sp. NPDC004250 TaxID=3364692 RepID=UPI0036BB4C7A
MCAASRRQLVTLLRLADPRMAERLTEEIVTALDEQAIIPVRGPGFIDGTRHHLSLSGENASFRRQAMSVSSGNA